MFCIYHSVIERFYLTRQDDRPVTVSQMKDVGNQVKSVTVQWKPDISDIGSHILCARAEDSDGYVDNIMKLKKNRGQSLSHQAY